MNGYSRVYLGKGRGSLSWKIRSADLRIFEKFQQTFVVKCSFLSICCLSTCNFRKVAFRRGCHPGKFSEFSEQLFLRKIQDGCFFQGTVN